VRCSSQRPDAAARRGGTSFRLRPAWPGAAPSVLLGLMPACYAYFFFCFDCFYRSDLAAISMDRTGTTHIGKSLLNHSFMIPGLIGVSTAVGDALSRLYF
jgi:anaerobic C4-dicarboxylate transporter DcuB